MQTITYEERLRTCVMRWGKREDGVMKIAFLYQLPKKLSTKSVEIKLSVYCSINKKSFFETYSYIKYTGNRKIAPLNQTKRRSPNVFFLLQAKFYELLKKGLNCYLSRINRIETN